MSLLATWPELSARLLHDSIGALLIAKWTVVMALAWLANAMLAGRNPRWRVALWRSVVVGLAMVAVLSATPPIVTYRLINDGRTPVDPGPIDPRPAIFGSTTIPAIPADRIATEAVSVREPSDSIGPVPSFAHSVVMAGRNDPAAGEALGFRWGGRIMPSLWSIWLCGMLLLTGRLIAGSLALARLVRRATDASEEIVRECRETALRLGCRRSVRVRRTSEIATPCLAGLWRPVLLLPASECDDARPDDLRAILAHELAHARNHDVAWNLAAQVASILLWFHPLAWRFRAAHAAACDAVCDAVAADLLGDVTSYGRTLARLAVRAAWHPPVHGLAMARTSDVRRRLEALNRMVFHSPLSRRHVMATFLVGSALLLLIGGFGFTRAEQAARDQPAKADERSRARDASIPDDHKAIPRAARFSGVVLLPDGKPAMGAEVALVSRDNHLTLKAGHFDLLVKTPRTVTGPDGRFEFPVQEGPFLVAALGDAGFAEESSEEFMKSGKLVLQAWGTIEGGVRIGSRLGANQEVVFVPIRPELSTRRIAFNYGYATRTDERGRFRFDRVIPGRGTVTRSLVKEYPGGWSSRMPCGPERVEVKPGQTTQVTVGGKGRPVIGRLVLDGTPESPVDWTQNDPVSIRTTGGWLAANIEKDGRFRIDDVPAGFHDLELRVNAPGKRRFIGDGDSIGQLNKAFNMPEIPGGRSNEPLDLGTMTVELFEAIKIGDLAPDFDVERIGNQDEVRRLRLSDYRGKLVLLGFWQAWESRDDMTVLEGVRATFGRDPRFAMISLACDKDATEAEKVIKAKSLGWTHGLAGELPFGVGGRYHIEKIPNSYVLGPDRKRRRIPLTFLIGPDGRIVAHDLQGADREAVRKALDDPKLFPAAGRPGPR